MPFFILYTSPTYNNNPHISPNQPNSLPTHHTMDTIAAVKLQKHTHDLIITHAQALYGADHSISTNWAVVTGRKQDGAYVAHAIVYSLNRGWKKWTVLMSSQPEKSVEQAERGLLEGLRGQLGRVV